MKKHILPLAAIAVSALALSSCLDSTDKSEQTFTYPYSNCFNVVTNETDGSVYIDHKPSYNFVYHTGMSIKGYVDISLTNVQLAGNLSPVSLQLPPLEFKNPSLFMLSVSESFFSPISQGQNGAYTFDFFQCDNIIGPNVTVYNLNYRLSNRYTQNTYTVKVYSDRYTYRGDINFTDSDGATSTQEGSNTSALVVNINSDNMLASLSAEGLVLPNGSMQSFGIGGLPIVLTDKGYTVATTPGDKLQLMNTTLTNPKTDWYISDINIDADLTTGATINFTVYNDRGEAIRVSSPNLTYFIVPEE